MSETGRGPRDLAEALAEAAGVAGKGHDRETLCDALARWLATSRGLATARRLQATGGLALAAPPPPPGPRPPEPIAIWQPQEIDGERVFVRPDPHPLGDHHAARKVLRPKRAELPLRVCLFGESVAAGYLYAPRLTPAQVLEAQLRTAVGRDDFEVIDLARTNETLLSLADTVRAALQINPDLLVLFAGNNWNLLETPEVSPYAPSVRARQRYAAALREKGLAGPARLADERLRAVCEEAFELIALIAHTVQIPVVVVIPEVNLADWESRQPPPLLPGDGVARWHALYTEACTALEQEDHTAAAAAAAAMLALDGGHCPTAFRLRARARSAQGDQDGARADLLAEVDAARYATLAFLDAPRATTAARALLHEMAARHRFAAVDLREVFAEHTGGALPGRRLFLDYCHLTREGMEVAMAAVAAEVLRLSGIRHEDSRAAGATGLAATDADEDWRTLLARLPPTRISSQTDATAFVGAAVHSAHRLLSTGSRHPLLEHWLDEALITSPGVEAALLDLIEARCTRCPAVLTAAQQRNLASPHRLTLQHGWRWDHLDADLLQALVAVLERRGTPAAAHATRLLVEGLAIGPEGADLADPFFHWEPLERFFPEVMDSTDLERRATYRAPWPVSAFCLVCDGSHGVELTLVARLPERPLPAVGGEESAAAGRDATRRADLAVNGRAAGTAPIGRGWTRSRHRVGADLLLPGLNRLEIRWPDLPAAGEDPLSPAVERLELGIAADLHPVFGEVWSLLARPR